MKKNLPFFVLMSGALLVGLSLTSHAADFTVNDTVDSVDISPGNGVCATASGSCSLRAAVMEANALQGSDTITLPAGTFKISLGATSEDLGAEGDLDILDDLTITGAGTSETEVSSNVYSYRIFSVLNRVDETSPIVTLSKLTLTKGLANDDAALIYSEADLTVDDVVLTDAGLESNAIYNAGGSLTLKDSEVSNNYRGIYLNQGKATVLNSSFKHNNSTSLSDSESSYSLASGAGAAILVQFNASSKVIDSTFLENESLNGGAIYSGGNIAIESSDFEGNEAKQIDPERYQGLAGAVFIDVQNQASNSTIKNSSFVSNTSELFGGAVYSQADSLVVIGSSFTSNRAKSSFLGSGGAIASGTSSYLSLIDSSFTMNEASLGGAITSQNQIYASNILVSENESANDGGGMHVESGYIFNSRIVNNNATYLGGGISASGDIEIVSSEISGNSSESDGGIELSNYDDDNAVIRNSTLANNVATSGAGGIGVGVDTSLELINSTLANNTVTGDRNYYAANIVSYGAVNLRNTIIYAASSANCFGDITSLGNNLSNDSTCGMDWEIDQYTIDPRLGELQDNGGNTHTMALEDDSPAINEGNAEYCNSENTLDQRGYYRSDSTCDIGAYERGSEKAQSGTLLFSAENYEVEEDAGSVTVTVNRSGGNEGEALVWLYDAGQGDATANKPIEGLDAWYDYDEFQPITLRWADGDTSAKSFEISVHDDYSEDDETITLGLAQASSADLGLSEANITILDLDGSGSAGNDDTTDDSSNEDNDSSDNSDEPIEDDQSSEQDNSEVVTDEGSSASSGGGAISPLFLIALVAFSFIRRNSRRES